MSKRSFLEKLLNGAEVAWLPLRNVATLKRGRVMSKGYFIDNAGDFPVYSSQTAKNGRIGKINTFDFDGEYISWTTDGANAGTVFHRTGKFSITNVCGSIKINDESILNYKYLFYWLSIEAQKHVYFGMGNPKLMSYQVEKIPVPIPCPENPEKSLAIQAEIVRILDAFTDLTADLTAELTAELTARKKQYNYYRDQLLTFKEGKAEWKPLCELGDLVRGNGLPKIDFTETGVSAIHYGQIYTYYGLSTESTISFVSHETAEKLKKVNKGDVVITNTSEDIEGVGTALVYLGEEQAVTGGHATIFKPSEEILGKYFAYFTQTATFEKAKRKYAKGTKVIDVSANDMSKIEIPIPHPNNPKKSLEEQARIVFILDKFNTLTNSISEGLPREIELRQKQYEYYRDQLLNFPKPEEVA